MALAYLARCLERQCEAISPALAYPDERVLLEQLRAMGAMVDAAGDAPLICPMCEWHELLIRRPGEGWCEACGNVIWTAADRARWAPDGPWLRRRIAQALNVSGARALPILVDRVWRIGDVGQGARRRRVLFGQRLTDAAVQRELHAVWNTQVGEIPAVLITTTPPEQLLLLMSVHVVPLAVAFRWHGTGLIADHPIWDGLLSAPTQSTIRQGPFSHDFRRVWLPGESEPIALTPTQSSLLRQLWELQGRRIRGHDLMRRARVDLAKPVDAFPKNKYPHANRAYALLVKSNQRSEYWLPRND